MNAKPRRSLHDIVTRSSLSGLEDTAQRKHLQVACLELRKTLCRKVRDAARARAEEMDRRILELDCEAARILAGNPGPEQSPPRSVPEPHMDGHPRSADRRGLTLRY